MSEREIYVVKSDGERELFNFDKLRQSLRFAGASEELAREIGLHIEREAVSGMSTADIYRHAFSVLHLKERRAALRYSLRRAVLALGPTGFPFERFVGELYKRQGYTVLLDQTVQGRCVDHELDLVCWNSAKLIMAEAKYHHELAYKSDLKVVLYVKARFDDLAGGSYSYGEKNRLDEGWLITNTKFTDKAIAYGRCAGVHLLGWNYPETANLHHLIEETGLHPVSVLTSISERQKQALLGAGIVLCESLRGQERRLLELGFDEAAIENALAESELICPAPKQHVSIPTKK